MAQVFISYSRNDMDFVRHLAVDLQRAGLDVWWDITDIQGSDIWLKKIEDGLDTSDYFILIVTPNSVDSRWVRRELLSADERGLKIIPVLLKACRRLPLPVRDLQPIDAMKRSYVAVLEDILRILQGKLGNNSILSEKSIKNDNELIASTMGGIEFVKVPSGKFLMGSKSSNPLSDGSDRFQHSVDIPYYFWIGRFPVVGHRFLEYLKQNKIYHPFMQYEKERSFYPAGFISWYDAKSFCKWLNGLYKKFLPGGYVYRLPTEAEWEKAARGTDGREWPWGNDFDARRCNSKEGGVNQMTPVDNYSPEGDSPYGVADMVGNVWEWTNSLYRNYPYSASDGRENSNDSGQRSLRGGGYNFSCRHVRVAARGSDNPEKYYSNYGFRVVVAPPVN